MELSIEQKLHEFAVIAIKEDSINILEYLLDLNSDYYEDSFNLLLLYAEAINNGSEKSTDLIYEKYTNVSKTRELK